MIYLDVLELCYNICPKVEYLKRIVDLYIYGNVKWVTQNNGKYYNSFVANGIRFDAVRKLDYLRSKIQTIDKDYEIPGITKDNETDKFSFKNYKKIIWIILGIFALIFIFICFMLILVSSK